MALDLLGATFQRAETANTVEYVLDVTSLPLGCTHIGENRVIVKKTPSMIIEVTHRWCNHISDYTSWTAIPDEVEPLIQLIGGTPQPSEGGTVQPGIIAMWSGLLADMPSGWRLCDGTNGAPDFRDKFVVGAAPGANPGATGGSASHSHTYDDVIQHTHTISVNDPGHDHVEQNNSATNGPLAGWGARDTSTNTAVATGYSTQSSTTGITASSANPAGSVAQGTTDTADSRPPYYAVAFIQKI